MNIERTFRRIAEDIDKDRVLEMLGLERRSSTLGRVLVTFGVLGIGALMGAGAALMIAPSTGKKLRAQVVEKLGEAKGRLGEKVHSLKSGAERRVETVANNVQRS